MNTPDEPNPPTTFTARSGGGVVLRAGPGAVGTLHEQLRRAMTPRPRKPSPAMLLDMLLYRVRSLEQAARRGGR